MRLLSLRAVNLSLMLGSLFCGLFLACSPSGPSVEKSALRATKPPAADPLIGTNARSSSPAKGLHVFIYKESGSTNIIAGKDAKEWYAQAIAKKQHVVNMSQLQLSGQLAQFKKDLKPMQIPISALGDWAEPYQGTIFFELVLTDSSIKPELFTALDWTLTPPSPNDVEGATPDKSKLVNWTLEIAPNTPDAVRNALKTSLSGVTLLVATKEIEN